MVYKGVLNKRDGEIHVYLFDHAILFTKSVKNRLRTGKCPFNVTEEGETSLLEMLDLPSSPIALQFEILFTREIHNTHGQYELLSDYKSDPSACLYPQKREIVSSTHSRYNADRYEHSGPSSG